MLRGWVCPIPSRYSCSKHVGLYRCKGEPVCGSRGRRVMPFDASISSEQPSGPIKSPIDFQGSLVHAQASSADGTSYDFISLTPESLHMIVWPCGNAAAVVTSALPKADKIATTGAERGVVLSHEHPEEAFTKAFVKAAEGRHWNRGPQILPPAPASPGTSS